VATSTGSAAVPRRARASRPGCSRVRSTEGTAGQPSTGLRESSEEDAEGEMSWTGVLCPHERVGAVEKPRTDPRPGAPLNPAAEAAPEAASTFTASCRVSTVPSQRDCTHWQSAGQQSGEEEWGFEEGFNEPFPGQFQPRCRALPAPDFYSRLQRGK